LRPGLIGLSDEKAVQQTLLNSPYLSLHLDESLILCLIFEEA